MKKEDEDSNEQEENSNEKEDEEEEVFHDVIKKDAEKLVELINELSQHSKFTDKAAKINTLMDSYLNNRFTNFLPMVGRRTKVIEDVHDILMFLGRERETVGLAFKI